MSIRKMQINWKRHLSLLAFFCSKLKLFDSDVSYSSITQNNSDSKCVGGSWVKSHLTLLDLRTWCIFLWKILSTMCCPYIIKGFSSLAQVADTEVDRLSAFFGRNTYVSGKYVDGDSFSKLNTHIESLPGGPGANRLFYLALPPTVYHDVTKNIKHHCMSTKSVHIPVSDVDVPHSLFNFFFLCYLLYLTVNPFHVSGEFDAVDSLHSSDMSGMSPKGLRCLSVV